MKDMRLKVAAALMFTVFSTLGAGHAFAAPPMTSSLRYICEPRQNLVVTRSNDTATVRFIDRSYELHRKASSIGEKYIANNAALIIDGKSAFFVAEDRLQLGKCVEAMRLVTK